MCKVHSFPLCGILTHVRLALKRICGKQQRILRVHIMCNQLHQALTCMAFSLSKISLQRPVCTEVTFTYLSQFDNITIYTRLYRSYIHIPFLIWQYCNIYTFIQKLHSPTFPNFTILLHIPVCTEVTFTYLS